MADLWEKPISAPFEVGAMLLLTDGSVLAHRARTAVWWRLKPNGQGAYGDGGWAPTGRMAGVRIGFASAVLADGRAIVLGGAPGGDGDLKPVEVYDPSTHTWTPHPPPPGWETLGEARCCVLPDGRLLVGRVSTGDCAIWNPGPDLWTAAEAKLTCSPGGETWTLLTDGSVLVVENTSPPASERFWRGAWTDSGRPTAQLAPPVSGMQGPAVLLPDGAVLVLGASNQAARFSPNPTASPQDSWTAAAPIPDRDGQVLGAPRAPACLLPNGRVFCALGAAAGPASPPDGVISFFLFDPKAAPQGAWSRVADSAGEIARSPGELHFLLLPTGQVLVSDQSNTLRVFAPAGDANADAKPTVEDAPSVLTPGASARIHGKRLTGLSQACVHGGDGGAATNYPLARLAGPRGTEGVVYGRTFNHSTLGLATGEAEHHTDVLIPPDIAPGNYQLSIVVNGVASDPVSVYVESAPPKAGRRIFAEAELFLRDLSEVHMLIDFISGRADKSLAGLRDSPGIGPDGRVVPALTEQEIVEEICKISYPPGGDLQANAQQAAFMLVVKDKLNYLAAPARGLTIAFTSMFSGVAIDLGYRRPGWWSCLKSWLLPDPCPALERANGKAKVNDPETNTFFSAKFAFPNLERQARQFRWFYSRLPWLAIFTVLVIAYLNWATSIAGATLEQTTAAEAAYSALFDAKQDFLPTAAACHPPPEPVGAAGAETAVAAKPADALTDAHRVVCAQADADFLRLRAGRANLAKLEGYGILLRPASTVWRAVKCPFSGKKFSLCLTSSASDTQPSAPNATAAIAATKGKPEVSASAPPPNGPVEPPSTPPAPTPATKAGPAGAPPATPPIPPAVAPPAATLQLTPPPATPVSRIEQRPSLGAEPIELEYFTRDVINALNSIIIPTLFGLLGTVVGLMRTITVKVRDSILAPRDRIIAQIGLGLGMSAGLAVGLFVSADKAPGDSVTLTAASLSFLAGFAAEAFFIFLDGLIVRVFALGAATGAAAAAAAAASGGGATSARLAAPSAGPAPH